MSEEETNEKPEKATETEDERVLARADAKIEELNQAAERKEKANARAEEIERLKALGGDSDAGEVPKKPKPMSDTEYAEALERGEVNPLREDGFIK